MKFFGLEINDILVSFVLTLIVSAVVTYFCHLRLKNIENAVTKQNQVLSSFITNVKNEINPDSIFSISSSDVTTPFATTPFATTPFAASDSHAFGSVSLALASDEAINAVVALENKNTLIEVSDDDESDSSDDDSEEEENESESEDEEKPLNMNLGNFFENDIKIIDLICIPTQQKYNNTSDTNNSKIIEIFDVNTSDTDSDDESEEELIVKKITVTAPEVSLHEVVTELEVSLPEVVTELEVSLIKASEVTISQPVEELDASNFIKKIHTTTHEEGETKLEKLKIEDLRHLAITKGIGSKDEVKKIKKPELIALLEKL